jgi:hypothetical protein
VPSGPAWTAAENATGLFERATRRVVTPRTLLDLTQTAAGVLSFDSRLAAGDAGARVEISVDGGDWHTLASVPESDDWLRLAIDLSPYAGHVVRVRFVLDPDAGGTIDLSRWQLRYVRSFF